MLEDRLRVCVVLLSATGNKPCGVARLCVGRVALQATESAPAASRQAHRVGGDRGADQQLSLGAGHEVDATGVAVVELQRVVIEREPLKQGVDSEQHDQVQPYAVLVTARPDGSSTRAARQSNV